MRKIIMIVLSFLMILNIPMSHAHADNTVEHILDNYTYEIFENDEKRFVDVINKETKHVDYIIYDKTTGVLTINGRNKKCVVHANHPRNASYYKMNFTVDYQTVGLLAGSILAFTATSISSLKKVMPAFKLSVGTQVKGCLKYKCHKNNRRTYITLTIKFGSGPKKSYSFKTSSLRMSTKLYI